MLEDGYCPQPTVFEQEPKESLVLDKYGNPFVYKRNVKIGFDLTPRGKTNG